MTLKALDFAHCYPFELNKDSSYEYKANLKALLWDEDGFLLLYKRFDNGAFQWPRNENFKGTICVAYAGTFNKSAKSN